MGDGGDHSLDVWGCKIGPKRRCQFLVRISMVHNREPHRVICLLSLECWLEDKFLSFLLWSSKITVPKQHGKPSHPPASPFPRC